MLSENFAAYGDEIPPELRKQLEEQQQKQQQQARINENFQLIAQVYFSRVKEGIDAEKAWEFSEQAVKFLQQKREQLGVTHIYLGN